MILIQIATALAIGAYVVLSKDGQSERPDATLRDPHPSPDTALRRDHHLGCSAELPRELANIVGEQFRFLECGEVPSPRHFRPSNDIVATLHI